MDSSFAQLKVSYRTLEKTTKILSSKYTREVKSNHNRLKSIKTITTLLWSGVTENPKCQPIITFITEQG